MKMSPKRINSSPDKIITGFKNSHHRILSKISSPEIVIHHQFRKSLSDFMEAITEFINFCNHILNTCTNDHHRTDKTKSTILFKKNFRNFQNHRINESSNRI